MIDFHEIAKGLYTVYQNGVQVSDVPVSRDELVASIDSLELSESDQLIIEKFYE